MDPKELERAERHYTAMAEEAKAFVERRAGATLRDEFAMRAMQGICAHPDTWGLSISQIVERSFEIADEMIRARRA